MGAKGFIVDLATMRGPSDDDLKHDILDKEVVDHTVPVLPLSDEVLTQKLDQLLHAFFSSCGLKRTNRRIPVSGRLSKDSTADTNQNGYNFLNVRGNGSVMRKQNYVNLN